MDRSEIKAVGCLLGHTAGVTSLNGKGDGRYLISNGKDHSVKLWDLRMMLPDVLYDRDDRAQIPCRNYDYRFYEMDPRAFSKSHKYDCSLMTYTGHRTFRTLIRAYFSPVASTDQRYIYCGSASGRVHIFDVLTGAEVGAFLVAHHDVVRDLSWHPTDSLLVSSSWDGSTCVWDHRDFSTLPPSEGPLGTLSSPLDSGTMEPAISHVQELLSSATRFATAFTVTDDGIIFSGDEDDEIPELEEDGPYNDDDDGGESVDEEEEVGP
jgi:WD40 repeat protein